MEAYQWEKAIAKKLKEDLENARRERWKQTQNERLSAIEDEAGHLTGFPELVVEVLSAGERNIYRDKQAKLKLYSQGGVKEYWIVDRFAQELEVYLQKKQQLTLMFTLTPSDFLTSPLLSDFSLPIAQILRLAN